MNMAGLAGLVALQIISVCVLVEGFSFTALPTSSCISETNHFTCTSTCPVVSSVRTATETRLFAGATTGTAQAQADFYAVLGVSKSANKRDIKAAYRKKAKHYHPDANKAANASEKFQEINGAYEVLSDAFLRRQYDAKMAPAPQQQSQQRQSQQQSQARGGRSSWTPPWKGSNSNSNRSGTGGSQQVYDGPFGVDFGVEQPNQTSRSAAERSRRGASDFQATPTRERRPTNTNNDAQPIYGASSEEIAYDNGMFRSGQGFKGSSSASANASTNANASSAGRNTGGSPKAGASAPFDPNDDWTTRGTGARNVDNGEKSWTAGGSDIDHAYAGGMFQSGQGFKGSETEANAAAAKAKANAAPQSIPFTRKIKQPQQQQQQQQQRRHVQTAAAHSDADWTTRGTGARNHANASTSSSVPDTKDLFQDIFAATGARPAGAEYDNDSHSGLNDIPGTFSHGRVKQQQQDQRQGQRSQSPPRSRRQQELAARQQQQPQQSRASSRGPFDDSSNNGGGYDQGYEQMGLRSRVRQKVSSVVQNLVKRVGGRMVHKSANLMRRALGRDIVPFDVHRQRFFGSDVGIRRQGRGSRRGTSGVMDHDFDHVPMDSARGAGYRDAVHVQRAQGTNTRSLLDMSDFASLEGDAGGMGTGQRYDGLNEVPGTFSFGSRASTVNGTPMGADGIYTEGHGRGSSAQVQTRVNAGVTTGSMFDNHDEQQQHQPEGLNNIPGTFSHGRAKEAPRANQLYDDHYDEEEYDNEYQYNNDDDDGGNRNNDAFGQQQDHYQQYDDDLSLGPAGLGTKIIRAIKLRKRLTVVKNVVANSIQNRASLRPGDHMHMFDDNHGNDNNSYQNLRRK
jgi:curved DNA-binding protein CbpA